MHDVRGSDIRVVEDHWHTVRCMHHTGKLACLNMVAHTESLMTLPAGRNWPKETLMLN
jgi:hypothetical protein